MQLEENGGVAHPASHDLPNDRARLVTWESEIGLLVQPPGRDQSHNEHRC